LKDKLPLANLVTFNLCG